ncbi:MAG: (2Fe-2S) ferredoxin domain-containing protein, partial [Phycisphaerae bacterium]|nr:(2Fe-2S) ferredoxin domain-containing protein [Phycisphaerae bacterium]
MIAPAAKNIASAGQLDQLRQRLRVDAERYKVNIAVCGGTGCQAYDCQAVIDAFDQELARRDLKDTVRLRCTGCHGFCERGPLAVISPSGLFYQQIKTEDVPEIVDKTIIGGEVIERLLYR